MLTWEFVGGSKDSVIYIYIYRERDEMNPIMINSTWANNITPMLDI